MLAGLRSALVAVLVLASAGAWAAAGDAEVAKGEAAFRAKAYGQAYLTLLPLAHRGLGRAQFLLGRMSDNGLGPIQLDPREAAKWYRRAAEAGLPEGQFAYANALATGRGVKQDPEASLKWLTKAADAGHVSAALNLAGLHDDGRGVPRNPELATFYVQRVADSGSARAQYAMGERLLAGQGVEPNEELAWPWFRRAAEQGHPPALYRLGRIGAIKDAPSDDIATQYMWLTLAAERGSGEVKTDAARERALLAQTMTPEAIKDAGARARAWKPKPSPLPPGLDDESN